MMTELTEKNRITVVMTGANKSPYKIHENGSGHVAIDEHFVSSSSGSAAAAAANNNSEPPDGGARAWFVVLSSFLCNGILFGVINTYGIIYLTLQEKMTAHGDSGASSKAGKQPSTTRVII